MTTTVEDKTTSDRQKILDLIGGMTEEISQDVEMAKTLSAFGIGNALTNYIDEILQDPLKASVDSIVAQEKMISTYLNKGVYDFLKSKKRLIYKAFKTYDDPSSLHYCIILNHNTLENRGKLREFKKSLIYAGLDARFPVLFEFIPKEWESQLTIHEAINL